MISRSARGSKRRQIMLNMSNNKRTIMVILAFIADLVNQILLKILDESDDVEDPIDKIAQSR